VSVAFMAMIVRSFLSPEQAGFAGVSCSRSANSGIDALDDTGGAEIFNESCDDGAANGFGVHGLGEDLNGNDVVVFVDDEPGEEVASLKTRR